MKTIHIQIILLGLLVAIVGIVVGKNLTEKQSTQPTASPIPVMVENDTQAEAPSTTGKLQANYELVATNSGQTALELLQTQAEVETQNYGSAGDFVTKINGLAGSNEYYWAFYLNESYAEKGASQTILKEGDKIKFVYEAVTLSN
jgi:hypothetical protein